MAAPFVTGVAALFKSKNLEWPAHVIKKSILDYCYYLPDLQGPGNYGKFLTAHHALSIGLAMHPYPPKVGSIQINFGGGTIGEVVVYEDYSFDVVGRGYREYAGAFSLDPDDFNVEQYLELDIPAEVADYLGDQVSYGGILLTVQFPAYIIGQSCIYGEYQLSLNISSSGFFATSSGYGNLIVHEDNVGYEQRAVRAVVYR
jgi:hypothetical protein